VLQQRTLANPRFASHDEDTAMSTTDSLENSGENTGFVGASDEFGAGPICTEMLTAVDITTVTRETSVDNVVATSPHSRRSLQVDVRIETARDICASPRAGTSRGVRTSWLHRDAPNAWDAAKGFARATGQVLGGRPR
jgi:hypothetical protein